MIATATERAPSSINLRCFFLYATNWSIPMTTKSHDYPTGINVEFKGKVGWIAHDQIGTLDKKRLTKKLCK